MSSLVGHGDLDGCRARTQHGACRRLPPCASPCYTPQFHQVTPLVARGSQCPSLLIGAIPVNRGSSCAFACYGGYSVMPCRSLARGSRRRLCMGGAGGQSGDRGRDSILSQVVPLPLPSRIRREVVGHDIGRGPGHRCRRQLPGASGNSDRGNPAVASASADTSRGRCPRGRSAAGDTRSRPCPVPPGCGPPAHRWLARYGSPPSLPRRLLDPWHCVPPLDSGGPCPPLGPRPPRHRSRPPGAENRGGRWTWRAIILDGPCQSVACPRCS